MLDNIINQNHYSEEEQELIEKAFIMAERAHRGQKRKSGEDYITHPVGVAGFLSEIGLDHYTIAASLLHDVLEDTELEFEDIRKELGEEVASLVDGVTKLKKIKSFETGKKENLESQKKMFFAMAKDVRVILIKLADRLHNMRTIMYLSPENRKKIALETLEIYSPIAARLGMGNLKGELEDLAFPHALPEEYRSLSLRMGKKYKKKLAYIEKTKPVIKRFLEEAGIKIISLDSRVKHKYSLYQKINRKKLEPEKIYDLVAMRLVVPDIKSCYEALGIIHEHYTPLPGLIKDYIALPKPNGYKSIHTTIFYEKGEIVEIQIRTPEMHEHAENGIASHWAYSEGGKVRSAKAPIDESQWMAQLKKLVKEMKSGENFSDLKIDFLKNRIFVFTPKGDIKDLPEGATPLDFAYAVHTEVGHSTCGAKVNGKMVSLTCELKNSDVVDIIKGKKPSPHRDWLRIVKTGEARSSIRSWFKDKKTEKDKADKIKRAATKKKKNIVKEFKIREPIVEGQQGLLYKLARCCNPGIDDKIRAYLTINKGVTIHAASCLNLKGSRSQRVLNASWSQKSKP